MGPWTAETDRDLFFYIIQFGKKWDTVAEHMGKPFTAESTRQHFQKMQREFRNKKEDAGVDDEASPAPKSSNSPRSRSGASLKPRRKRKAGEVDRDSDDEGSPSKKPAFKFEGVDVEA